jgi:hypothetical protein
MPFTDRFWSKVVKTSTCWNWRAASVKGYGRVVALGKARMATHAAWFLETGTWPPSDMRICHHCDNPACVRFSHLFLGSQLDNMRDAAQKGRLKYQVDPGWCRDAGLNLARWHDRHPEIRRAPRTPSGFNRGEKAHNAKLTADDIREIRRRCDARESQRVIASDFGVSASAITVIKLRKTWTHVK